MPRIRMKNTQRGTNLVCGGDGEALEDLWLLGPDHVSPGKYFCIDSYINSYLLQLFKNGEFRAFVQFGPDSNFFKNWKRKEYIIRIRSSPSNTRRFLR